MGLSLVHSRALIGLDARPVQVEVHLANGLPSFTLVGLADTEVKEARCLEKLITHKAINKINDLQAICSLCGTRFRSHKLCAHNFSTRFEKCGQFWSSGGYRGLVSSHGRPSCHRVPMIQFF
jgi:ribosomal protein L32